MIETSQRNEIHARLPRLRVRVDLGMEARIGPGKILLLEEVSRCGWISGGGDALKTTYRRAWELVEEMNQTLGIAVVETATGGCGGGRTHLTKAGKKIVQRFRRLEKERADVAKTHIESLLRICKPE